MSRALSSPSPADVAIVVLTHSGADDLGHCLDSCLRLVPPERPGQVVVATNGAVAATRDAVRLRAARSPVRWLDWPENLGFAGGYNRALGELGAEGVDWAMLLNDDARLRRGALAALCDAAGETPEVACVGARLLDWSGGRIDFDGGAMSFTGHGHALGHGEPALRRRGAPAARVPTLFCSGAAMLVHVPTFLDLGGFDASYFAYYEDVDLGWRFWQAGYRAVHVPSAVLHHRGGGSGARLGDARRAKLHERNALATAIKNFDVTIAPRAVPAALALAAWRAALSGVETGVAGADATSGSGSVSRAGVEALIAGAVPTSGSLLPPDEWTGWPFLECLWIDLDRMLTERARVQAARRRADADIVPLWSHLWAPVPASRAGRGALALADRHFGLREVLGAPDARFTGWRAGWSALRRTGPRPAGRDQGAGLETSVRPPGARHAPPTKPWGSRADAGVAVAAVADAASEPARLGEAGAAGSGDTVDVVVVNFDGAHLLAECLPALNRQTHARLRITVVDNGSRDGSSAWLAREWPGVALLDLGSNVGFAEANNRAIQATSAPWVALLNNDAEPSPDWLSALLEIGAADPRVGSVASRMVFRDRPDVVNSAGIALDPTGIAWDRLGGQGARSRAALTRTEVFGASAGAALFRRSALRDVAESGRVFDRRYFMYFEDVDLAWRLRLRGWRSFYEPDAHVLHAASATAGEGSAFKNRLLARNKVWTLIKNYPARGLATRWPAVLAYDLASVPYRLLLHGQAAALLGRIDALRDPLPALRQRAAIQAGRRVPWSVLLEAMEPLESPWAVARRYRHLGTGAGARG